MSKTKEVLISLAEKFDEDEQKFLKGNHSAGVRARKTLQAIKKLCTESKKNMMAAKVEA